MEVLSSRNVYSVIFVLGSAITMLTSFWGFNHWANHAETIERLNIKTKLWSKLKPVNYSYTAVNSCMFSNVHKMAVENELAHAIGASKHITIDDRFSLAKEAITLADKLKITYHPIYNFPLIIEVEWNVNATDNSCSYSIKDFSVNN